MNHPNVSLPFRDPVNDTVIDLFKKAKSCRLLNEIYADHAGQTKEEDDAPPPGHRRGKRYNSKNS